MPLLALVGQFTSTCSLKSRNLRSLIIFEPGDWLIRQHFSTTQLDAMAGLSNLHPAKSWPLKRVMASPHLMVGRRWSAGARLAVQVQVAPLGPLADPINFPPVSLPSNT